MAINLVLQIRTYNNIFIFALDTSRNVQILQTLFMNQIPFHFRNFPKREILILFW